MCACEKCICYEKDIMYLNIRSGKLICHENVLATISLVIILSWTNNSLCHPRYIVLSDFDKLFSFQISENSSKKLNSLTENFLLNQLNKNFKTLDFYKSIANYNSFWGIFTMNKYYHTLELHKILEMAENQASNEKTKEMV